MEPGVWRHDFSLIIWRGLRLPETQPLILLLFCKAKGDRKGEEFRPDPNHLQAQNSGRDTVAVGQEVSITREEICHEKRALGAMFTPLQDFSVRHKTLLV